MQIAAFLGVAAACGYGLGDFFGATATKRLGPVTAALYVHVVCLAAVSTWYLFAVGTVPELDTAAMVQVFGGSTAIAVGGVCLYRAFDIGPVALVSPLGAMYPLVIVLIGVTTLDAHLTLTHVSAVGLILSGVVIAAEIQRSSTSGLRFGAGPVLALTTAVLWGGGYALLDSAVETSGWEAVVLVEVCTVTLILGAIAFYVRIESGRPATGGAAALLTPSVIAAGLLQVVADAAIVLGLSYDSAAGAVVTSASACYPAITMMLAIRYFHETVRTPQLLGALLAVAGVTVLLV
ncbi:EamA family transporter [Nocardia sp. NPDC005978]|uniref:DMT family transporter n=1 Tax=unclassified Nocardia TaxID=2637762 RepID=UPI0033B6FF4F